MFGTLELQFTASWRSYVDLCKPRVVALIMLTAIVGMLLAPSLALQPLICGTAGIALAAAAAAVINHVADHRIDALMIRTQHRPLPQGSVDKSHALIFAAIMSAASMTLLIAYVNLLTAVLTAVSLIGYAVVYTLYLKRATPQNIVIGGAAGAAPPVLGWVAMTGTIDPHALLLFLIIFAWTPPHFWSLAIYRRHDYARADIPMLPITHGVDYTRLQIFLYTVILSVVSLLPFATYMSGMLYLTGAIVLDALFLYHVVRMQRDPTDRWAMKTFTFSIVYLAGLFLLLLADRVATIHALL